MPLTDVVWCSDEELHDLTYTMFIALNATLPPGRVDAELEQHGSLSDANALDHVGYKAWFLRSFADAVRVQ